MASCSASERSSGVAVTLLLCATIALLASPVNADTCSNPCWTSDSRNQGMIAYLLNMEYLLAESYSCWSTGTGIPDSLRGGGPPSIGCQKMAFEDPLVAALAGSFAQDNMNHVAFWRNQLGAAANPMPQLNVGNTANPSDAVTSFIYSALTAAGYKIKPGRPATVDNFVNSTCQLTCAAYCKAAPRSKPASTADQIFLLSAFIYEDVMVTAYEGDIGQLADSYAGLGMQAAASYHAGSVRQQLIQQAFDTVDSFGGLPLYQVTKAISDWRAKLSFRYDPNNALINDDQNIIQSNGVSPTLVPSNGYTFDRIPSQTTAIFIGNTTGSKGLFFPAGFTNAIKGVPPLPGNYPAGVGAITTKDTFTFALNLEYLEAEFYTWAIYGYGISKCAGTCGPTIGGKKANLTTPVYVRPRILALTLTLAP
jgi:hypothetical protein